MNSVPDPSTTGLDDTVHDKIGASWCWKMFKHGISERDAVSILLCAIATGLILGHYFSRGLSVVLPIVVGLGIVAGLIFLSATLVWELIQSPPTLPPEAGLVALGSIAAICILTVVGYYAEKNGWAEVSER